MKVNVDFVQWKQFPVNFLKSIFKLCLWKPSERHQRELEIPLESTNPMNEFLTYNFLSGAQNTKFSKAHVEGRALEGAIGLPHHDDVDATRQRGLVDPLVQLLHRHQHLARQLPHVVHGVRLSARAESGGSFESRTSGLMAEFGSGPLLRWQSGCMWSHTHWSFFPACYSVKDSYTLHAGTSSHAQHPPVSAATGSRGAQTLPGWYCPHACWRSRNLCNVTEPDRFHLLCALYFEVLWSESRTFSVDRENIKNKLQWNVDNTVIKCYLLVMETHTHTLHNTFGPLSRVQGGFNCSRTSGRCVMGKNSIQLPSRQPPDLSTLSLSLSLSALFSDLSPPPLWWKTTRQVWSIKCVYKLFF